MYVKAKSIAMCVKYLFSGVSDLAFVCFNPTSFVHYAKRLEFLEVAYILSILQDLSSHNIKQG